VKPIIKNYKQDATLSVSSANTITDVRPSLYYNINNSLYDILTHKAVPYIAAVLIVGLQRKA